MLRNADLAMYTAKSGGKNCARVFADEMHHAAVERLDLEAHLRGAAGRGELIVHYQPMYELESGRLTALEALVRWQHPERGLLPPGEFLELAEETGLIVPLGDWVLRAATAQVRRWCDALGAPIAVSVNVSGRQLEERGLIGSVEAALAESGLPPSLLVLELTESMRLRDPDTGARLERLRSRGVRLALDDFGSGYSSLGYLRRLPIDVVKIDRSFVHALGEPRAAGFLDAVIGLARSLDLTAIAEGIETDDQRERLARMNCPLGQGFRLGRPRAATDVERLLRASVATAPPPAPRRAAGL
jgi:EAL domain-containing protein (putative c-di-GMP-specific phosphodiesterase class I)